MTFTFALYMNELREVLKDARADIKNENEKFLHGDYIKFFINGITKSGNDTNDLQLRVTNGVTYTKAKRGVDYLRINGNCKLCEKQYENIKGQSNNILKYTFIIEQDPFSLNDTRKIDNAYREYIEVVVKKLNEHKHNIKQNAALQILGENRTTIAKEIISSHCGSSKKYREALIGEHSTNIASEDVYRQVVHEYNNNTNLNIKVSPIKELLIKMEKRLLRASKHQIKVRQTKY
jgi:hypothetical protein